MRPCFNVVLMAMAACWIMGGVCQAKVHYKVKCSDEAMLVELVTTDDMTDIYLEQLQHYPDPACHPQMEGNKATFKLSLKDVFQCGVTKVTNQATGRRVFYHRIVVESEKAKQVLLVKCVLSDHHAITKRNVLPAGFMEPEDLEITPLDPFRAPEPVLGVGVRQGGQLVTGELNVNPGTPLEMEIFLDNSSAPVYGILVSYMQVTDTKAQQEIIIFNGCSVDPYLFENFNTVDGDFLKAKFRAFKFPESTYVQFKGTVNVCLDKCRGVDCSNGQVGYGRRRREVSAIPADPNKVFEVSLTTFIKVDYKDDKLLEKGKLDILTPPEANETAMAPEVGLNNHVHDKQQNHHLKLATEEIREELEYTVVERSAAASLGVAAPCIVLSLIAVLCMH